MNVSASSVEPSPGVHWSKILLGVFLYLIVSLTIFGNILVLMAIKSHKRLQTVFNIYVVNLALTDVLVAVTAMSFYTLDNILGYWPFGRIMCGVWIFFDYGMTFVSVFTLCIISIDRFWAVSWPIHYKSHNNTKKAIGMVAGVWWVSFENSVYCLLMKWLIILFIFNKIFGHVKQGLGCVELFWSIFSLKDNGVRLTVYIYILLNIYK